eukprot:TRINITY_DN43968_c0_g1_i1.p1 TRINITY_DN43968_c0_g1~~TRINITY_DN43968_c0_g1_i1.p1  ORF type:complete len:403 (-),score=45.16 TRINITY_DN43968_c0_g1_i1:239-1399(-)
MADVLVPISSAPPTVLSWCDSRSLCAVRVVRKNLALSVSRTSPLWNTLLQRCGARLFNRGCAMNQCLGIEFLQTHCKRSIEAKEDGKQEKDHYELLVVGARRADVVDALQILCFGPSRGSAMSRSGFLLACPMLVTQSFKPSVFGELPLECGDVVEVLENQQGPQHSGNRESWAYGINTNTHRLGWFPLGCTSEMGLSVDFMGRLVRVSAWGIGLDAFDRSDRPSSRFRDSVRSGRVGCVYIVNSASAVARASCDDEYGDATTPEASVCAQMCGLALEHVLGWTPALPLPVVVIRHSDLNQASNDAMRDAPYVANATTSTISAVAGVTLIALVDGPRARVDSSTKECLPLAGVEGSLDFAVAVLVASHFGKRNEPFRKKNHGGSTR